MPQARHLAEHFLPLEGEVRRHVSEAQRLKQLEDENRKLKQMVADLMLDKQALQAVLSKKW